LALQRIYELAPEEGRQLILNEIARPQLRVSDKVLGLLPDAELSELEDTIVQRAINPKDGFNQEEAALGLVDRYASAAALPRLRVAFENQIGNIACRSQESLLAYFLRADEDFGIEMLNKALGAREKTRCYANALTSAVTAPMSPGLKQLVIDALDDKNEDVMSQAAEVLSTYGEAANKTKVKARIRQQLDQWRAEKRNPDADISSENSVQLGYFSQKLLYNYAHALAWFNSEAELREVEDFCPDEQCREQARIWTSSAGTEITFHGSGDENAKPSFRVAQYDQLTLADLKTKLAQFPNGSTFTWQSESGGPGREDELFNELKDYLAGHGMKLATAKTSENQHGG
jgi:hypothetical protein